MKRIKVLAIIISLLLITGCNYSEKNTKVLDPSSNTTRYRISAVWKDENCFPVRLELYKNGKYEFYHTYRAEIREELDSPYYLFTKSDKGKYKYKISKIIQGLDKYNNEDENIKYKIEDVLYHETYVVKYGEYNKYLDEFLKSIDVNLDMCAKEDSEL